MRHALWLLLVPVAALADAASAKKSLDTARTNLTQAVERIKVDPPSNADLDAAVAAVEALKSAIDAGAEFEGSDLDYAKDSLTGRKELREKREYVEQRRAMVKIFDARRAIDAALKALTEKMTKVAAKEPSTSDFNDAQAAVDAAKKTVDDSRAFTRQDPKFASYVTETDANIAKQQKAITDKRIALGVDKQRAALTAARDALKAALGELKAGAGDDKFKAADGAVGELNKRIEEGKPLEPQKAYQAEADKARAEVAAAKKKMDELWTATGLAKLKGEIDPAYQELLGSQKRLRNGKATPEQLGETRTAAIVVRGLVEKFAAEAERSQAFGQYVAQVKKTLVDVETDLEKRTLGAAKADVVSAQKAVERASVTDEQFGILNTAIGVLEKTLGTVHKDEPLMAPTVSDVQAVLKDAKAVAARRRSEVDTERDKKTLTQAKNDVFAALGPVEKSGATDEQFAILNTAIGVLEKTLGAVHKDEPLLAATMKEMQTTLEAAKAKSAKRRVEIDVERDKKTLAAAKGDVVSAQRAVEKASVTDEQFGILNTSIGVLEKTLETVHKDEPLLASTMTEMHAVVKDAKAMWAKRRLEVDVERQKGKVEEARKVAGEAMKPLGVAGFGKDQIDAAENSVKLIGSVLEKGTELTTKDKGYAFYDAEVKKRVKELEEKIAFKRQALAASDAKTALLELAKATGAKIQTANTPDGKDADVDAATKSLEALTKMLEANAAIEKGGLSGYPAAADRVRNNDVFKLTEQLEMAKFSRELRKKTGDVLQVASAAVDAAANEQNLKARKGKYDAALGQLRGCQQEGNLMLANYPVLAKIPVVVDGKQSTPREVMAQCVARAEAAEQLMKDIAPLIKFEEGPKKSFEIAKALLDKGKKDEALKQFNECIATGSILAHDNPELKERKFQVAGSSLGLSEIIQQCVAQKKALSGK